MKCQICENPATVHLTDISNKKKRELHLCERCARERNLIPKTPESQIDLKALLGLLAQPLMGAVPDSDFAETPAKPAESACGTCGLTVGEFKATGRFGCPNDYDALRTTVEPLLERIHRALAHTGKAPSGVRLRMWKKQMQDAIAAEQYEEAARLRDLIRQKEAQG